MTRLEYTLRFLESELEESEKRFKNRGESYDPYCDLGRLKALVRIAIKAIKQELERKKTIKVRVGDEIKNAKTTNPYMTVRRMIYEAYAGSDICLQEFLESGVSISGLTLVQQVRLFCELKKEIDGDDVIIESPDYPRVSLERYLS